MRFWISSRLIGWLLRSAASRRHLGRPYSANEAVPIISLRVNLSYSSDANSSLQPVSALRFRSNLHVALLRGRGQIHLSLGQL